MGTTVDLVTDRAPSVDLTVYRKEVYNFLRTVTIKYEPMINLLNEIVILKGGTVDDGHPETWKYYKNAVGEYHESDTPMYIFSLDTKEKVLYSRDVLSKSPRTLEAYSVGQDYFKELCELYPTQLDLIKNIRYPVSDWETLYNAPNLTYITGEESLLEENERDSLIRQLKLSLKFIDNRWNFPGLEVEELEPIMFLGMLFQILASALFAQRFENIRTQEVHSWHVWQYITSQGLSDYSDLLTFSQSMFLYRNLDYLNQNRGKQSNLVILADNLLQEWSLSLYGRNVMQRSDKGADDCLLYPDLVAKIIPTKNASDVAIPLSSVDDMVYKLIEVGNELPAIDYPPEENAARQERLLSDTTLNEYPTKVVEIAPVDRNKKFAQQFDTYIYDSLVYGIVSGLYSPSVELPSKISSKTVALNAKDCLLLFNYCMFKAFDITPTTIPTIHKSALALKPSPVTIREWYNIDAQKSSIYAYVDVNDYTNGYFQMDYLQSTPNNFSTELLKGFETISHQVSLQRLNSDVRVGKLMRLISENMLIIGDVPLGLTTATTYQEWLARNPDLVVQIIGPIEASTKTSSSVYADLATSIVDTLVPVLPGFNTYGNYQVTDTSYQRIKQLFTQFTSYNITFVDDNTTAPSYIFSPQYLSSLWSESSEGDSFYYIDETYVKIKDYQFDIIEEPVLGRTVSIDKDLMEDPSFGRLDVTLSGTKEVKENSSDLFYTGNAVSCSITDKAISDDVIIGAVRGVASVLTLPAAPVPLNKGN